jgi:NADH-quinone oxidoreductase subunit G
VTAADPASKYPSSLWERAREKLGLLIVQDIFLTKTAQQADVVLPAFCFIEKSGHFVNVMGSSQKLEQGTALPQGLFSDGEIFTLLAKKLNYSLQLGADFIDILQQQRLPLAKRPQSLTASAANSKVPDGALLATFAPRLFDGGVRMRHNVQLFQQVKQPKVRIHPKEGEKRGLKNGAIVRLHANDNSITTKLTFDERVAEGTLILPLGFEEVPVAELGANLLNGLPITIES